MHKPRIKEGGFLFMANMEENQDKRENKSENRNVNIDQNSPEIHPRRGRACRRSKRP